MVKYCLFKLILWQGRIFSNEICLLSYSYTWDVKALELRNFNASALFDEERKHNLMIYRIFLTFLRTWADEGRGRRRRRGGGGGE